MRYLYDLIIWFEQFKDIGKDRIIFLHIDIYETQ